VRRELGGAQAGGLVNLLDVVPVDDCKLFVPFRRPAGCAARAAVQCQGAWWVAGGGAVGRLMSLRSARGKTAPKWGFFFLAGAWSPMRRRRCMPQARRAEGDRALVARAGGSSGAGRLAARGASVGQQPQRRYQENRAGLTTAAQIQGGVMCPWYSGGRCRPSLRQFLHRTADVEGKYVGHRHGSGFTSTGPAGSVPCARSETLEVV